MCVSNIHMPSAKLQTLQLKLESLLTCYPKATPIPGRNHRQEIKVFPSHVFMSLSVYVCKHNMFSSYTHFSVTFLLNILLGYRPGSFILVVIWAIHSLRSSIFFKFGVITINPAVKRLHLIGQLCTIVTKK